ncbi:hypothetical protein [Gracilibacillus salinarum]|uniref:Uncharacterized protein n=1 Tax=Gracilibacillus salinarum TaxID=2932255 RepID=A0ABY4GHH1_9BACI|nr:hypothetical protein [Gracilibacillus salinarum]UOQ83609.1 hypothetical protein MUN87_12670 [Gracilibacillus salinarum]
MIESGWDIREVKRLKKIKLVQTNLLLLFCFALYISIVEMGGNSHFVFGSLSVSGWVVTAMMLYTLKTGKTIGTKVVKRVSAFDKDFRGEERWRRRTMIETVIVGGMSVAFTVCLFVLDFGGTELDYPSDILPLIGCWVGHNIGEIVRLLEL